MGKNKKIWMISAVLMALILGFGIYSPGRNLLQQVWQLFAMLDVEAVKAYILSFGIMAPVVSFFLMVFQSVAAPLPAFLLTFANAGIFGWVKGAILSWTSAMAGAALCFYLARFLGRTGVEKLTTRYALERIDKYFEKYGKFGVLILRLLPFISFDVVSYGAGLTSMGFWPFFWATGLGQLPATMIYSYVGGMLVGSAKTFVYGLLLLFALSVLLFAFKKGIRIEGEETKGVNRP